MNRCDIHSDHMATSTQYGNPLFLSGLEAKASAEQLTPVHFSKVGSGSNHYDEAWLQDLIMRHPSLLPVDQIEPAFNPLVPICRELPMNAGSLFLDNLLVTPVGDLALVECKLWRNPQARREVVAQILDYATAMSTWSYEALEAAIGQARPIADTDETTPRKLYDMVSAKGTIDEVSFHDAVTRNLERGRFILLIVGDGIREGATDMAEFLQQHAGFHFTLAFVELALFKVSGGYIAQPRVLAKTKNIERAIVIVNDGHVSIVPPKTAGKPITITEQRYFEELEKNFPGVSGGLSAFLDSLTSYGVLPEFGIDSLILRWRSDDGKPWNLGTIPIRGDLWLDPLGHQTRSADLLDWHKKYLERLAALVPDASVNRTFKDVAWFVALNGKPVNIDVLVATQARRDGWLEAIKEFQSGVLKGSEHNE